MNPRPPENDKHSVICGCRRPLGDSHKISPKENGANISEMLKLSDILKTGDEAAANGTPLISNWPQIRASLHLIDRCVGLKKLPVTDFKELVPEDFWSLDRSVRDAFPHAKSYEIARREVSRLLAVLGHIDDPWEALRVLIRNSERDDLEPLLWPLVSASRAESVAPKGISDQWVWSLSAETEIDQIRSIYRQGRRHEHLLRTAPFATRRKAVAARRAVRSAKVRRQVLRRAVVAFDALFDLPEIAGSGLLPEARVGMPPRYDRRGRRRLPLPAELRSIAMAAPRGRPTHLQEIWQAIQAVGGLGLPDDPTADDLLANGTWQDVRAISPSVLDVGPTSWAIYHRAARAALQPHVSRSPYMANETLPQWLIQLVETQGDRQAVAALWRRTLLCAPERADGLSAGCLLRSEFWRDLWHPDLDTLSSASLRQYESRSRKLLRRAAPEQADPFVSVREAWKGLSAPHLSDLEPVRRLAERALLRPGEVSGEWLIEKGFQDQALWLDRLQAAVAVDTEDSVRPTKAAWRALRRDASRHGIATRGLGPVEHRAIDEDLAPWDLDTAWTAEISSSLSRPANAKFRAALRILDSVRRLPTLADQLPAQPVTAIPDRRRKGNRALPENLAKELETLANVARYAENTRRANRTLVRELYTRATEQRLAGENTTLRVLLEQAADLGLNDRTLRRSKALLARALD